MLSFTYDFSGMVYSLEFSPSSEEGRGRGGGGDKWRALETCPYFEGAISIAHL